MKKAEKVSKPKEPKAPEYNWVLSGPCPTCAAPVLYSIAKNDDIHLRRTCVHNVPPVMSSGHQPPTAPPPVTQV